MWFYKYLLVNYTKEESKKGPFPPVFGTNRILGFLLFRCREVGISFAKINFTEKVNGMKLITSKI